MTKHLWIPGPLPGLNEITAKQGKGRGYTYAALKQRWTNDIAMLAKRASLPTFDRVIMHYHWVEPNKKRDPSNIAAGGRKLIEDGLVTAKVLPNDGWRNIAGFTDHFEVGNEPGCALTITTFGVDKA